jgi:hypothetical protein
MSDIELVVLQSFASQMEADLAKSVLESAGIAAAIEVAPIGDTKLPFSPVDPLFRLLVREEDVTAALTLLSE